MQANREKRGSKSRKREPIVQIERTYAARTAGVKTPQSGKVRASEGSTEERCDCRRNIQEHNGQTVTNEEVNGGNILEPKDRMEITIKVKGIEDSLKALQMVKMAIRSKISEHGPLRGITALEGEE